MKELIIEELERLKLKTGNVWWFFQIRNFRDTLNPRQQDEFGVVLQEMIDDGLLVEIKDNNLRITDKCYQKMYFGK